MLKSISCGDVRPEHVGVKVTLAGWVHTRRDHGNLIFLDMRDRAGVVQVVLNPEVAPQAHQVATRVRNEWVVQVTGSVTRRPAGTENPDLPTGEVEVTADHVAVLNESKTPPFYVNEESEVDELLRLKYRYLDLRRSGMRDAIITRHRVVKYIRDTLDARGFVEIETPILIKSTPEGARDYLVPSRLYPGHFYALPQSPQQLKQLLMVSGFEKYFQIARCFRDEDLRADRQPEHTQLDLEMSFVEEDDVLSLIEEIYTGLVETLFPERWVLQALPQTHLRRVHCALWDRQARPPIWPGDGGPVRRSGRHGVSSVPQGPLRWWRRAWLQGSGVWVLHARADERAGGVREDQGRHGPGVDRPDWRAVLAG